MEEKVRRRRRVGRASSEEDVAWYSE